MIENEPRDENKWGGAAAEPADEADPKPEVASGEAAPDEPATDAADAEASAEGDLSDDLRRELDETKERLLRSLADVENMRRRHSRELEEARKYAITGFARELVDIADNLNRAIASVPPKAREKIDLIKNLSEGVALTEKMLLASFEKHHIKKVEPAPGEKFDHNRHQAMFEVATNEHAPGSIAQVVQPGYVIADRLLRPAMVGVAKAGAPAQVDDQASVAGSGDAAGDGPADGEDGPSGDGSGERPGDRLDTVA
jgi:molecular chaperone GrpE